MNNKHVPEALPKEYKTLGNSDTFYLYCYFLTILLFQKWPKLKFDKFPSYKTPSIVSLRNRKKRTAKRMCVTIATWLSLACFVVIFT